MVFCLIKPVAEQFKKALKSGEIDPGKLSAMSSIERRSFFARLMGEENARQVNALFESKLLLKNQEQGMINWAKQITGIKPEVRKGLIEKIQGMKEILSPKDRQAFLNDLAAKKLGIEVTADEAGIIAELSAKVGETKAKIATGGDRLEYGAARVMLEDYVNELKFAAEKMTAKEYLTRPDKSLSEIGGFAKSLKASLDNSAIFRQGWKTMFTNPTIWAKNAFTSFVDIGKNLTGKQTLNGVKAEIYSRPNALKGLYDKLGIDIGIEEAYPSALPEKLPIIGRAFKASEGAYKGFLYRMRADIADQMITLATKTGVNLNESFQARSIGKLINSLTGRGSLGSFERAGKAINNVLFSAKFVKSNFDVLTLHSLEKMSPFARRQAALNLTKIIGGTAAIMSLANFILPGSAELDPRSSNFGKIKIKDTTFDISGGMAGMVTLAARIAKQSTKNKAGKIVPLGSGFGQKLGEDLIEDFIEGKLSPIASTLKNLINQSDFYGKPITLKGEASNLLVPLPISNYEELRANPNSANIIISMIADALGISTNTPPPKKKK